MDIELEAIEVTDFGPFIGTHKLQLSAPGTLTFVKGRNLDEPALGANGAGKSFLLNAIPWCLHGKTVEDLGNTDIRPWADSGKTDVRLTMTAWEGKEGARHTVARTTGGSKNTLTIDGRAVQQDDVDKLVGWSHAVFALAPFLGQGKPLFHDLPNREKLAFLVEVLGLDRWDGYSKAAGDEASAHERQLARLQGERDANKTRVEELTEHTKRLKASSDEWDDARAKNVRELGKVIKSAAAKIADMAKNHDALTVKLDGADLELRLLQDDLRKLDKAHEDARVQHRTAAHAQITADRERERAEAELKALREDKLCPTCQQPIKDRKQLADNLKQVEGKVRQFAKDVHTKAVTAAMKAEGVAAAKVEAHEKLVGKARTKRDAIYEEHRLAAATLLKANTELGVLKRELADAEQGTNPHRDNYVAAKKKLDRAVQNAGAIDKDIAAAEKLSGEARYWVKGFKDIRLNILEDVLDELELVTNAMLDQMGLVGWSVRYDVERETKVGTIARGLNTTVIHPKHKRKDVKWKNWSGGEAQRLRIAGALSLAEVVLGRAGVDCNILVLDEPTQHLSRPQGVDDLCRFLSEYARDQRKSIYLVDHQAIEASYFDRTVVVTKDKAGSRIDVR